MKRYVALSFALSTLLYSAEQITIDTVNVTADSEEKPSVLTDEKITQTKPIDLSRMLSDEVPNINYAPKGPIGSDLLIRGFIGDEINVLIDGEQIYGACPNRMDPPAMHVNPQQIQGVTIVDGPYDVRNTGSMGGMVDVKTKEPQKELSSNINLFYGSFNYYSANADITGGDDLAQVYIGASYQQSEAYVSGGGEGRFTGWKIGQDGKNSYKDSAFKDTAFDVLNVLGKLNITPTDSTTVKLAVGVDSANDVFYPGLFMDAEFDNTQRVSGEFIQEDLTDGWNSINVKVYYNQVQHVMSDKFRKTSDNPMFASRGYMMKTDANTSLLGTKMFTEFDTGSNGRLEVGYDGYYRNWTAGNQIMALSNNMIPDVDINDFGLYADFKYMFDVADLLVGVRGDIVNTKAHANLAFLESQRTGIQDSYTNSFGSGYVKGVFYLGEHNELRAGYGHGVTVPTQQERFIQLQKPGTSPNWIGNPDINPTTNDEFDVGYTMNYHPVKLEINAYYSYLSNYIYQYAFTGGAKPATSYTNIDAGMYGADATIAYQIINPVTLRIGGSYDIGYKITRPQGNDNDYLAQMPAPKAIGSIAYNDNIIYGEFQAIAAMTQTRYDSSLNEQRIPGYGIFNVKGGYNFSKTVGLYAEIDNIFNQQYATSNALVTNPFSANNIVWNPGFAAYVNLSIKL